MAHTSWFFEEFILNPSIKSYKPFNEQFSFLFNSYYNNVGERLDRAKRGLLSRPSVSEIIQFREYVDSSMLTALNDRQFDFKTLELIELGLNHEQQHQELLLTDLKFAFYQNPLRPIYSKTTDLLLSPQSPAKWIDIDEGIYTVGHEENGFCFDNEKISHRVFLEQYQISDSLVTNGEFLKFVNDGAYSNFNLWLDEGWSWINKNSIKKPLYWSNNNGEWFEYTLGGMKPLKLDQAVAHLSYYEAAAFAEWTGKRLPTEIEWEVASDKFIWGNRWEWTNSAYLAYPGFTKAKGAVGEYNGKFMVNQMVLRGASCATAEDHSRKTYRNFFHPNLQWQYSGIRLAK